MNEHELMAIDLRRPHERVYVGGSWIKFKRTETTEGTFFVPTYISPLEPQRRGWKVRIKRAEPPFDGYVGGSSTPLHDSLWDAWRLVVKILLNDGVRYHQVREQTSSINTGRTGVRLGRTKPDVDRSFALRVGQSLEYERAHSEIFFSVAMDELTRENFNTQYARAVAARNYYDWLRQTHYRLSKPITRKTHIPEQFYPTALPVPDLYDRLVMELD